MQLPGYRLGAERSRDARLATWEAVREADGQPVLVMMPRAEHPTPADIERVRLAHDMLRRVSHPAVLEPLELLLGQQSAVLVMRRPAGAPVGELLDAGPLPLDSFLRIAADMAGALAAVHAAGIVHRAISTDAFFSDAEGRSAVVLGDFQRATLMPRQTQGLVAPTALEGNLTYLSPEQTGRINRSIDFRTDLYSLGVVLYELLTGRPPFVGTEPLQLVHSHIARHPSPPSEHRPNLPPAISAIVLKLLAKNAEDRYASAAGLEADLRTCLDAVRAGRPVPELEPGAGEVSSRFQIPEKLYGREAEVARLVSAFERVGEGRPALLLVAGYSGVGKSSLVREIHRPVVERRGYFADGKFDQFKRNVPFASLHSALRSLVRQILAEDATRIAAHRDRLLEAVGPNGQLLVDVVPEFGRLLGPQPAVPELPGREARNRFQRLLRDVVAAFCSPSHPLCLFLDDLQWVDSATLDWLESMLTDSRTGWLFLIGAYRDHEVGPAHPLALMFQRLRAQSLALEEIALAPLDEPTVERITADTLHAGVEAVRPLAQLVSAKTGGNAFFVNQLLESLHRTGAITFDSAAMRWRWDPAQAAAAEVSENVVEFVTERLHRMDDDAQRVLHVAACLGNQFSPALLGMVSGDDDARLRAVLGALQVEGFLVEAGQGGAGGGEPDERLRFVHDRVQQAAYGLRGEGETHAVRLRVGRHLLAATADAARDDALFDILQHFNVAAAEVTDRDEQLQLAALNLAAAARARAATAYGPAQAHVTAAEEFARRAGADGEGGLAFDLALEQAECAHLLGNEEGARAGYARALAAAGDDFERGRVYEQKIHFHTNRAEFRDAFATGLEAAALFGIKLPRSFVPPLFLAEYGRARMRLRGRDIPGLVSHPELTDERRRVAMQFMGAVAKAGFQIRPELCVHICTRIVNESLTYGNTPETVIGYLAFGVIFSGSILGNADAGYRYGQLVLGLVDRYDPSPKRAEVNFVYGYFAHSWARPYASTERYFRAAYQAGIDTGDYFHAGLACAGVVHNLWMRGARLEEVEEEATRLEDFLVSVQGHEPLGALQSIRAAARALRTPAVDGPALSADGFDEQALVASLPGYGSPHVAHIYHVTKLQAMVLRRDAAGALAAAAASKRFMKGSAGLQQVAEHEFWNAFAQSLAGSPRAGRALRAASRRFAKWSRDCAENFESRRLLLAGEAARLNGRLDEALLMFERSMETAHRAGQLQYEAMAGERAGEIALAAGRPRAAQAYLGAALDGWRRWGAEALAAALESRHPGVAERGAESGAGAAPQLDLQTVVKSSQAISRAVQLPALLATLLETVRENAGAERAVVFLIDETGCTVQADGRVGEPTRTLQRIPLASYDGAPRSMVNFVLHSSESIVIGDASRDAEWATDQYVRRVRPRSVLCAPIMRQGTLTGVIYLENNATPGAFTPERLEVISVLSAQIAISLDNAYLVERLEERVQARTQQLEARNQFIRRTFGRFLSDDVVDSLLDTSAGSHLGGEKRKVTIMMADLRGFSSMAEALPPETVMAVINNYLGAMTEVIMAHQGTIDEFIGDAILAIFGAPVQRDDDAERAVACALAMQRAMEEVNARNRRDGLPEVAMGIGLNTGEVVVGSIGSEKRAKYGVVGAAVNLASRIEGHTLPGQILVSARTRDEVAAPLRIERELRVQPKGSREPMSLYDVVGIAGSWNLSLERAAAEVVPVARSIEVEYGALSGKSIGAEQHRGAIVALDEGLTTCVLQGALPLSALDNVWLTVAGAAGVTGGGEERAYGKVTESDGDGRCTVRFTSVGEPTLRRLREVVVVAGG